MNDLIVKKTTKKGSLGRSALEASEAAIKKAEFFGTSLFVKDGGVIKELTPRQMKSRLTKLRA